MLAEIAQDMLMNSGSKHKEHRPLASRPVNTLSNTSLDRTAHEQHDPNDLKRVRSSASSLGPASNGTGHEQQQLDELKRARSSASSLGPASDGTGHEQQQFDELKRARSSRSSLGPASNSNEHEQPNFDATKRARSPLGCASDSNKHEQSNSNATKRGRSSRSSLGPASNGDKQPSLDTLPETFSSKLVSKKDQMPTICFSLYSEPLSTTRCHAHSLDTLDPETPSSILSIGRQRTGDNTPKAGNSYDLPFGTKVVTGEHCQVWYEISQS
ncbi:hypothetical protein KC343_g12673 [Hortaea werneckii]|nr:hypothetical protein KC352_g26633 [Hortaea werneckii]KAI7555552.1 hypothetical protein KC317_g12852 [Hortaea werneckii]KAI7601943.1 hypothetical protein KC346_g12581 [Hortaea werneckii]KAI7608517.1 hypothetical protein KC343_g12673 [Hortaea werneckii]KAI7644241.1 hypothetical protein KC319_g12363 [Hortaea werneckii]